MRRLIARLLKDTDGQDLIEYALLCGLMSVVCIIGILELTRIIGFFETMGEILASAI